jgi:hypothetical protein
MDGVDRLREALVAAGLSVPEHGYADSVLSGLEQELAPLRLPAELRELWARLQVGAVPLGPRNPIVAAFTTWFADLSLCWWLWRAIRDRPGLMPEVLLPVVWYGGVMQLVELADDASDGGRIFEWRRGAGELEPCYPSIGTWLGVLADLVADDAARLKRTGVYPLWLDVSEERERELRLDRFVPDTDALVASDPTTWAQHWRAVSRAFDDRRPRRQTELSISEFVWDPPGAATVAGLLRWGTVRPGPARLQLADGTGWLDVWCPAELPGLWLTEHEKAVELDVTADVSAWPPSDVSNPEWPRPYPPQATATSLRLRTFG